MVSDAGRDTREAASTEAPAFEVGAGAEAIYREGERRVRERRLHTRRKADDDACRAAIAAADAIHVAHLNDTRELNLRIARLEHENRLLREALVRQSAWGALAIFRAFRRSVRELAITRN